MSKESKFHLFWKDEKYPNPITMAYEPKAHYRKPILANTLILPKSDK